MVSERKKHLMSKSYLLTDKNESNWLLNIFNSNTKAKQELIAVDMWGFTNKN